MRKQTIDSVMEWSRRTWPEAANAITTKKLFEESLKMCGEGQSSLHALEDFDRDGDVPDYVDRYVRAVIFPTMRFTRRRKQSRLKGDTSCTSEQRL